MKGFKKLSWQLPFLLFLLLGTYYALTQSTQTQQTSKWHKTGDINGISYSITIQSDRSKHKRLSHKLEQICTFAEQEEQKQMHPDSVSAYIYRTMLQTIQAEGIKDFQIQIGKFRSY